MASDISDKLSMDRSTKTGAYRLYLRTITTPVSLFPTTDD